MMFACLTTLAQRAMSLLISLPKASEVPPAGKGAISRMGLTG